MVPPSHATATSSPRLYLRMQLQPARSASARAAHPVYRIALHRILCSAAHRANATSPRAEHCIANNPRTENQPATHRPPRPLRIIRCTAHTSHLQRLHALRSTLRWFRLVRGTNFSKIQFIYIVNCIVVMCS
jgi:hypothetical protein